MSSSFSASEIVEIAIQIEINGRDFYSTVALNSENIKIKESFLYLAGEEEKHIDVFRKILEPLENFEPKEAYNEEYFAYMRSLADDKVFTAKDKGKEIARNVKSDVEAIALGIKAEQYSIIFYEGMKKIVPDNDKHIIDRLIEEEKSHLAKLNSIKGVL